jgi:hypothetical protein
MSADDAGTETNKKMIALSGAITDGVLLYLRPLEELKKTVCYKKTGREF